MRLLLIAIFVFCTPGLLVVLWDVVISLAGDGPMLIRLGCGLAVGLAVHTMVLRRLPGLMTLQHEAKHALMAWLFLRRVRRFVVTWRRGGAVVHERGPAGALGDRTIAMAPYFLIPLTIVAAAVRPLVPGSGLAIHDAVFGALLAVDLGNIAYDLRLNFNKDVMVMADGSATRTDIGRQGYTFTIATVVFHGSWLLIVSLTLMTWGYGGLPAIGLALLDAWRDTAVWLVEQGHRLGQSS